MDDNRFVSHHALITRRLQVRVLPLPNWPILCSSEGKPDTHRNIGAVRDFTVRYGYQMTCIEESGDAPVSLHHRARFFSVRFAIEETPSYAAGISTRKANRNAVFAKVATGQTGG